MKKVKFKLRKDGIKWLFVYICLICMLLYYNTNYALRVINSKLNTLVRNIAASIKNHLTEVIYLFKGKYQLLSLIKLNLTTMY